MSSRLAPFPCTLLRDYPPEDLWAGYVVFGQRQPDGRIFLSEYLVPGHDCIGAAFEDRARLGFHFSIEGDFEQVLVEPACQGGTLGGEPEISQP